MATAVAENQHTLGRLTGLEVSLATIQADI
jgi:hypothetical protein